MPIRIKKRLGECLVAEGIIRDEDLEHAFILQKESKKKLGRIFLDMGYLSEQQLTDVLSRQLSVPTVDCLKYEVPESVLHMVPGMIAQQKKVFPLEFKDKRLKLAMADPMDWQTIDDLSFRTGAKISVVMAPDSNILEAVEKSYKTFDQLSEILDEMATDKNVEYVELAAAEDLDEVSAESIVKLSGSAPIVRLVTTILLEALKRRASDVHLEPGARYVKVRFRVDGDLRYVLKYPKKVQEAVTSRLKIISSLDIINRRFPQDGRSTLRIEEGRNLDLRISTIPTMFGEKVVIRLLDRSSGMIALSKLGMPDDVLKPFITNIMRPEGMLLVTGPTGSGKTTTLYAALNQLQTETKNIISIEDPVEYRMPAITQIQINEATGLTFSMILRSIFRQDPDIVYVGEIRDLQTAEISIRAALTGHYVLSTLHTSDTVSSITRLMDMGIPKYLIASTLSGLLAQRLVKKICTHCKEEAPLPEQAINHMRMLPTISRCYVGKGCVKCDYSGYLGREGVYEFLEVGPEVKDAIAHFSTEAELWEVARAQGTKTLIQNAVEKIEAGITTVEEVSSKISYNPISRPRANQ